MADHSQQLHFVLFPVTAPGHMLPMIDIAKLLAQRGVVVSVITTPKNALRFASTIDRAVRSGQRIRVVELRLPCVEVGLPEGCESLDSLPSMEMSTGIYIALNMLQKDVEQVLEEMSPRPSCLISDLGLPWTTQTAEKFNIPRIIFHGTSCFSLLCGHNIRASQIINTLSSDTDPFEVPNLPDRIVLRKGQFNGARKQESDDLKGIMEQVRAGEKTSYGVVVNSFVELEPEYAKGYSKAKGEKVWCIGPVSLSNVDSLDMAERGNRAATNVQDCLNWLDLNEPGSVVYASLGSLARLTLDQKIELALGLEASNRPFIWALGGGELAALEEWLSKSGFSERTKDRAFLIHGWAPQVLILSHHSIGGFLTHCGWNSTLEGISAGVPMATWPFFADQYCNEKLVVQILRVGVSIGVQVPVRWGDEDKVGVVVKRDDVMKVLESLMDEGEEGEERRRRVRELQEKAKSAVEGGSSHLNIASLIEDIKARSNGGGSTS